MLASDVQICQEALAVIRQDVALAPDAWTSPSTKVEKACRRAYDPARRAFLALHDWNFARTSAAYSAAKPAAVRVLDVQDADGVAVRWRLDGSTLSADAAAARTVYTRDVEDVSGWPPLARSAFVLYLARELAVLVTGRSQDLEAANALFSERLAEARVADLSEGDPADDEAHEVLALVRDRVDLDRSRLANTIECCNRRLGLFRRAAAAEVIASHNWTTAPSGYATLPPLARAAALVLAAQKIAAHVGAGVEAANALAQLYERKLQKARIRDLVDSPVSDGMTKEILATIQGNYSSADSALPFDVSAFTGRVDAVKGTVRDAILSLHHWNFARKTADFSPERPADCVRILNVLDADGRPAEWSVAGGKVASADGAKTVYTARSDPAGWPALVKSAYVAAVAAEIVQACVPDAAAAASVKGALDRLAEKRLVLAKVADLNEDGSGAEVVREVKAVLKADYRASDGDLDEAGDALALRIGELLEGARREVLDAHNWNFARASAPVACAPAPGGAFAFVRPADAARLTAVRSRDGGLLDWTLRGNVVVTRGPAASIAYVRDVEDIDAWPPLVRRALVYRLAADAALSLPGRGRDPAVFLQLHREKLQEARVADAREGNAGRAAWGRSLVLDSISGRDRRGRGEGRPAW